MFISFDLIIKCNKCNRSIENVQGIQHSPFQTTTLLINDKYCGHGEYIIIFKGEVQNER